MTLQVKYNKLENDCFNPLTVDPNPPHDLNHFSLFLRLENTANSYLTPHSIYLALGNEDKQRQSADRALFRTQLDKEVIEDLRLALNQNQPLGNHRFYAKIESLTGERREAKPRGRPKTTPEDMVGGTTSQGKLAL